MERGQTPYSPATTIFLQLHERLNRLMQLGINKVIEDVHTKALFFRKLCMQNNWEVPAQVSSNCITGFFVPNGETLFTELLKENIYIMPGGTPNYFRVSHIGLQSETDLINLSERIIQITKKKNQ